MFFNGFILDLAITPFKITMVQTYRKLALHIDSCSTVTGFGLSVVLPFNPDESLLDASQ